MSAMSRFRQSPWSARFTLTVTLCAMQWHALPLAHAGLSQLPLLSNSAGSVLPNFVFTLDNSGSMAYNHLPEDQTVVNGYTVAMAGSRWVKLHPDDMVGANGLV